MKRYYFNIRVMDDNWNYIDDFNEWKDASSEGEAINRITNDYPKPRYDVTLTNIK